MAERYKCTGQIMVDGRIIEVHVQVRFFTGGDLGGSVLMREDESDSAVTRWDIAGGSITGRKGPYGAENPLQFIDLSKSRQGTLVRRQIQRMRDTSRTD